MPRLSKALWRALLLTIFILIMVIIAFTADQSRETQSRQLFKDLTQDELQAEKLRQEIIQLQLQNNREKSVWGVIPLYATFLTAVVAITGVFITIWKQLDERRRDREQREIESLRHSDEKFMNIIEQFGAEKDTVKVNAAVSIQTYLKPEYESFHDSIFLLLLNNLKMTDNENVVKAFVPVFEKAIRIYLKKFTETDRTELDLTRMQLLRVDLTGLNLNYADFAYSNCRHANLSEAICYRIRGIKVDFRSARFSGAKLIEARFKESKFTKTQFHDAYLHSAFIADSQLQSAEFQRAELQSAHFGGSNISGAQFQSANINNAFFHDVIVEDIALKSLLLAYNWDKAQFDDTVKSKLQAFADSN